MNRLLKTLALSIASLFAFSAVALAATPDSGWKVNISSPANTTSKNFNIQYTTLSITASDNITVQLFQDNVPIRSQTTAKAYGDAGAFNVTVPVVGTYSYHIKATNSGSGTSKTTSSVDVVVSDSPQGTAGRTNTGSTDNNNTTSSNASTSGSGQAGGTNQSPNNQSNGEVNAAETGSVGDKPASTDQKDNKNKADDKNNSNNKTGWIVASIVILAAIAGYAGYTYWWVPRQLEK